MRQLLVTAAVVLIAAATSNYARAEEQVEIKGVHLCCGQCVKAVGGILKGIDGVTNPKCDQAGKTVTFTAKDAATADKAFAGLLKGGFYGQAKTGSGKALTAKNDAGTAKAKSVTVSDVHVCCNSCRNGIKKLFPTATITYTGEGAQRTVTIAADNLEPAAVLETLRKGGFNGTVAR